MKLAALDVALFRVEVRSDQVHPSGVAHQYHLVGKLFGTHMKMKHRTVFVDDKFGWGKVSFRLHSSRVFLPQITQIFLSRFCVSAFHLSIENLCNLW